MQCYVDVILPLPLADSYTYLLPNSYAEQVQVGSRVVVQFGPKRYYTAIVVRKHAVQPEHDYKLKEVIEVLDYDPIVESRQLQLWQWIADYYMCFIGDVYKAAIPSGLKIESETIVELNEDFISEAPLRDKERSVLDALLLNPKQRVLQLAKNCELKNSMQVIKSLLEKGAIRVDEAMRQGYTPKCEVYVRLRESYCSEAALNEALDALKRAAKQQKLLLKLVEMMAGKDEGSVRGNGVSRSTLLKESRTTAAILNGLIAKGIVETYLVETGRLNFSESKPLHASTYLAPLSAHQQCAFDEIVSSWETHDVCLLHGVTSSGKTEVYIHLINEQLRKGRQVLFLVPEIALTQQMTDRLRRVFGTRLGVYHSKFSDAERVEIWQKQLSDTPYDVVLGVRSSVFLPFRNLGLVIVDEEHETTYKQQEPAPRYHARSVAVMLASYHKSKVLLGTATPSMESFYNAQSGKYGLVQMTERFGQVQLPRIEIVDLQEEYRKKRMYGPFSTLLYDTMSDALSQGRQVILFQNRRGYAPMMECSACGWVPRCDRCDVSLTYHRGAHQLICHYCGNIYNVPVKCPSCGSKAFGKHGMGTERIEEEVNRYFPKARVARMDLDTTRTKSAYERILTDFEQGKTDVLIGTQMVSKGLDFANVHVVGILNADTMLNYPDFRAYERSYHLMAQVAGRAGRRGEQGLVVLQTRNVDLPIIRQVMEHDYAGLYGDQIAERELFRYPPFSRLISVYVRGRDESHVIHAAEAMAQGLRRYFGTRVLGPEPPAVARVQGLHIRKLLFKAELALGVRQVRNCFYQVQQELAAQGLLHGVALYYDVDPY